MKFYILFSCYLYFNKFSFNLINTNFNYLNDFSLDFTKSICREGYRDPKRKRLEKIVKELAED